MALLPVARLISCTHSWSVARTVSACWWSQQPRRLRGLVNTGGLDIIAELLSSWKCSAGKLRLRKLLSRFSLGALSAPACSDGLRCLLLSAVSADGTETTASPTGMSKLTR